MDAGAVSSSISTRPLTRSLITLIRINMNISPATSLITLIMISMNILPGTRFSLHVPFASSNGIEAHFFYDCSNIYGQMDADTI